MTDRHIQQPAVKEADRGARRELWADVIRVAAVLLIFFYHFTPDWLASLGEQPSTVHQFVAAHFSEWGIAAFVVLSAFALGLALSRRRTSYGEYCAHRLARIFAPYWTAALPFALVGFALGEAAWVDIWKLIIWLLGLGPVSPSTFQPISEAWWYVSLALQISLLLPLMRWLRQRLGLLPITAFALATSVATLAAVNAASSDWHYLSQGLVLCRLSELMIGLAAAELVLSRPLDRRVVTEALISVAASVAASPLLQTLGARTSWQAMAVLGSLFALGGAVMSTWTLRCNGCRWLTWAAALSYCFYLTHAPVSKYSGRLLVRLGVDSTLVAIPVVLVVCVLVAWVFDRVAARWVTPYVATLFRRLFVRDAGNTP